MTTMPVMTTSRMLSICQEEAFAKRKVVFARRWLVLDPRNFRRCLPEASREVPRRPAEFCRRSVSERWEKPDAASVRDQKKSRREETRRQFRCLCFFMEITCFEISLGSEAPGRSSFAWVGDAGHCQGQFKRSLFKSITGYHHIVSVQWWSRV